MSSQELSFIFSLCTASLADCSSISLIYTSLILSSLTSWISAIALWSFSSLDFLILMSSSYQFFIKTSHSQVFSSFVISYIFSIRSIFSIKLRLFWVYSAYHEWASSNFSPYSIFILAATSSTLLLIIYSLSSSLVSRYRLIYAFNSSVNSRQFLNW